MPSRHACKIRAIRANNPEQVITYDSLQQAKKDASEWAGKAIHHQTVKRWADGNKEMYGYKWENIIESLPSTPDGYLKCIDIPIEQIPEWMQSNRIHIRCTLEQDTYWMSVYDFIVSIFGHTNPRGFYDRIKSLYNDVFNQYIVHKNFPGKGMRYTPCFPTSFAKQFVSIVIQHIDITNAKRRDIIRVFNIPPEIIVNIRTRHEIETIDLLVRVFAEYSPKVQHYISQNYRVDLYLVDANIVIECDEFGHSSYNKDEEQARERYITDIFGASIIRYNPCNMNFHVGDLIRNIYDAIQRHIEHKQHLYQEEQAEMEIRKLQISLERERMEHERAKMAHELEMKRLELQLMQGNISPGTSRSVKRSRTTPTADDTMDAMEVDNNTDVPTSEQAQQIPMLDNPSSLRGAYDRWLEVKEYFLDVTQPPWKKQFGTMAATYKLRFSRMRPFFNYMDSNAETKESADAMIDKLEMIRRKHRVAATVFIKSCFYDLYHLVSTNTKSPIPRQKLLQELLDHNLPVPSII